MAVVSGLRSSAGLRGAHVLAGAYAVAAVVVVAVVTAVFRPLFPTLALPYAPFGLDPKLLGLLLWAAICLETSDRALRSEAAPTNGSETAEHEAESFAFVYAVAPVIAAALLGGPAAGLWVAVLGLVPRVRRPGPMSVRLSLAAGRVIAAAVGSLVLLAVRTVDVRPIQLLDLAAVLAGATAAVAVEQGLGMTMLYARTGRQGAAFTTLSQRDWLATALVEACLAWFAAIVYALGLWWAPVLIVLFDAVGARAAAHRQSTWRIRHNAKSSLPTRLVLDELWARHRKSAEADRGWLLYLDLDGFKPINDKHGHAVGDAVLAELGRRLAGIAQPDLFIGHLHGDEFVAFCPRTTDRRDAEAVADELRGVIAAPIDHGTTPLRVTATVGFASVGEVAGSTRGTDGVNVLEAMLQAADQDMSSRKHRGHAAARCSSCGAWARTSEGR